MVLGTVQNSALVLTLVFRAEGGILELRKLQGNTKPAASLPSFTDNERSIHGSSSQELERRRQFVIIHINYWVFDMGIYFARVAALLQLMEPPSGPVP